MIKETSFGEAHNMKLKLTKEPVAKVAYAIFPPEPLGSLTWCYAAKTRATFFLGTPSASSDFTKRSMDTDGSAASIFATRD